MKKIILEDGGPEALNDNWLQLQDALIEAIKGLGSPYGNSILSGCVIINTGGTNYSVTEGWIIWDGEVYHVPAHTFVSTDITQDVFYKSLTTIPNPVLYLDGTSHNLVNVTEAKIQQDAAPGVDELSVSSFSIVDQNFITAWTAVTFASGFGGTLKYRKRGNSLQLQGYISAISGLSGGLTGALATTLPSGFRPTTAMGGAMAFQNSTTIYAGWYYLALDGTLTVGLYSGQNLSSTTTGFLNINLSID